MLSVTIILSSLLLAIGHNSVASDSARADSTHKKSAVINLDGMHDITISGKTITGEGVPCITLQHCYNIRITGNILSNSKQVGIYLYQCKNIKVDHNYIANVSSGVYADHSVGGGISVTYNEFYNMQGPFPRGQFVQFNNVKGRGNIIGYNKGENMPGKSFPEDAINLFESSGTAESPIVVKHNQIRGGGPSPSGGGIMLGDHGGSYQIASDNVLVDPGQYGMAIAGGNQNAIINNSIFGAKQSFTNVGLYVNTTEGHVVTNAKVMGNKVRFYSSKNFLNNNWLGPGTDKPAGWDNSNEWNAPLDKSILPAKLLSR